MILRKKALYILSAILVAVLSSISFTACIQKPVEEETTAAPWSGKEELELPKSDDALKARYEDLKAKSSLAFKSTPVTDGSDFETEPVNDGIKITKYKGKSELVVIPSEIEGTAVTSVATDAFKDTSVTAIYIPDSVVTIEKGALDGAKKLATLRIPFVGDRNENTHFGYLFNCNSYENQPTSVPSSLDMVIVGGGEKISENAFAGCKSISAIVLPDTVTKVDKFAFYECSDLVYLDLGGANTIGSYAMGLCSSLYSIDITKADSIGLGALYSTDSLYSLSSKFVGGSENENRYIGYIFGAETADFNDEFVSKSLRSVTLTNTASIPDRAFASCAYITEISIPEGVTEIGVRAFYSCRSLISFELPDSVKGICDDAFFACEGLTSVSFGSSLEKIGMQAFFSCRSLDNVVIPNSVKSVGASAFALCSKLKNVKLTPATEVGKDAFLDCPYSQS